MLRAIACLGMLFILSTGRAEAGPTVVTCPTTLKLNPNFAPSSALGAASATRVVGADLVCQFAPISFDSFRSLHPAGCPAKSANAAVSGGSGAWNFGAPGSSNVVKFSGHATLIWKRSLHGPAFPTPGCAYTETTPPAVAVWQAAPANTTCTINASNRSQFDCVLPPCLATLKGSSFPTAAFSPPGPGFTNDSAIINVANGQPVLGPATVDQIKAKMGTGAFNAGTFTLVGGPGSDSTLGAGVITCSYDGPRFQSGGETLEATITVACTGSCGSL
jgi:hypothetical protein